MMTGRFLFIIVIFSICCCQLPHCIMGQKVDPSIKEVHVVYMTHFDLGFTNLARYVCELYFFFHFPAAIKTANALREKGGSERFVYTSHPWLILEFLDGAANCTTARPSPAEIQIVEEAITRGDITWHAKPFNELCEAMSPGLFSYGLTLSSILDKRFNVSSKIAASSKDVPGVSKAVVPLLAKAGIKALHIGANPICTPPSVPNAFMWKSDGYELLTLFHGWWPLYGGTIVIPGFSDVLVYNFTVDNSAPHTPEQVVALWSDLKAQYPNAQIRASSVDEFALKVLSSWKDKLPVITQEMGNTWLYGIAADPLKVSVFREISRYLGPNPVDSPSGYLRRLMKNPEHNWGLSVNGYLSEDSHVNHWQNAEWYPLRNHADYQILESGWKEAREFLFPTHENQNRKLNGKTGKIDSHLTSNDRSGVIHRGNVISNALQDDLIWSVLGPELRSRISALIPLRKDFLTEKTINLAGNFESDMFTIGFDVTTGAINNLVHKPTNRVWADATHLIGKVTYQTYSMDDFTQYNSKYNPNCGLPCSDFSKPGMGEANPVHNNWQPSLVSFHNTTDSDGNVHFLLELNFFENVTTFYGCPDTFMVGITLPKAQNVVLIEVNWFGKPATRLAEAIWASFSPLIKDIHGWGMDVLGQIIDPLDVVSNGSRHSHAVWSGVKYPTVIFGSRQKN